MKKTLLFALLLLLISCETNPPTLVNNTPEYGKIFVTSNIPGAVIYIDNVSTGIVTPDTITVETGEHVVSLELANYQASTQTVTILPDELKSLEFELEWAIAKIVLLEDFSNTSCDPCVEANLIIEQLINESYGHTKIIGIKYPTYFPGPNDPFYLANKTDSDARIMYYNIFKAPTVKIDGYLTPSEKDSNDIKSDIDQRLAEPALFDIGVSTDIAGLTYSISIELDVLQTEGTDFSELVLHTVVTETDIHFDTPTPNGETDFYDVMRLMLPNNNGESLASVNSTGIINFNRQATLDPSWDTANLHTVVFIQNNSTKEVLQAGSDY